MFFGLYGECQTPQAQYFRLFSYSKEIFASFNKLWRRPDNNWLLQFFYFSAGLKVTLPVENGTMLGVSPNLGFSVA